MSLRSPRRDSLEKCRVLCFWKGVGSYLICLFSVEYDKKLFKNRMAQFIA
jgi:hypothetical protein